MVEMESNNIVKKSLATLIAVALITPALHAQSVLWAKKVVEVSSEYRDAKNPGQYAAKEILGPPSIDPAVSNGTECAWSPADADSEREEYITVAFEKAISVRQIAISEALGAGAIVKVILFNGTAPTVVWTNPKPGPLATPGKMHNLFIEPNAITTSKLMVVLNTKSVSGYHQIDAIGISESTDTIKAQIHLAAGILTEGQRENLGPNVNSQTDELLPVITPDGQSLFITRQGHPQNLGDPDMQDIYVSRRNPDGSWGPATNLGPPLNNKDNNAVASLSPDGQTLILLNKYKEDGSAEVGVSYARRNGESWDKPEGLEIENFYNRSVFGEYALASSGKTLILTIQRDDAVGGKDLYVSFLQPNGNWTAPKNMGATVNTAGGESTPFLAADDATLYFSTNGRVGYGSKDMFVTRRLDSTWTNWTEPENLGPLLNTPAWDAYYSIPAAGDYAYFVSYGNSIGRADIFRAPLPKSVRPKPVVLVKGRTLNANTKQPLGAEILYESLTTGKELGIARSNPADGSFAIVLPAGELYGFLGEAKGFIPVSENIDIQALDQYQEITRDLYLVPIENGSTVRLNNLFFDTGKWDLRPQSTKELGRLVKLLNDNPTMTIQIAGHTDDVGSDATNLDLSKKRAASVQTYLVQHGIAATRLSSKGYGETKPQVPNDSPEHRQVNRRVEFSIIQK